MKKLLMLAALLCGIQNAGAAFIDSGTYLTDTTSGLDWLDVTASVNRSFNDVSSQFGLGGDFAGWRYATKDEFSGLVGHWSGLGGPLWGGGVINYPHSGVGSIDGLVAALGPTYVWPVAAAPLAQFLVDGLLGDGFIPNYRYLGVIMDDKTGGGDDFSLISTYESTSHQVEIGSFLVRQSAHVPEPTTVALFGLGLAGLCFGRRKVKANGLS